MKSIREYSKIEPSLEECKFGLIPCGTPKDFYFYFLFLIFSLCLLQEESSGLQIHGPSKIIR